MVSTALPSTSQPAPDPLDAQLASLQEWVVDARGLEFLDPVGVEWMTAAEAEARSALLMVGWPSFDLPFQLFGVDPSVSGDPFPWWGSYAEGEIWINSEYEAEVAPAELLVHELVHAVTDQHFGQSQAGLDLVAAGSYGDRFEAQHILAEGDASFVGSGYRFAMSTGGLWDPTTTFCGKVEPVASIGFDAWYLAGEAYVCRLFQEGGWAAVNARYQDLPSTAEIWGIACDAGNVVPMAPPEGWVSVFADARGPLWFANLASFRGADLSGLGSWCYDYQNIVESQDGLRVMMMDIWVDTEADADLIADAAKTIFEAAEIDVMSRVMTEGRWVGILSTLGDIDWCDLPNWCSYVEAAFGDQSLMLTTAGAVGGHNAHRGIVLVTCLLVTLSGCGDAETVDSSAPSESSPNEGRSERHCGGLPGDIASA
ncbi:MAG TPA: hypothetical protein DCY40_07015 [Actinobacteria bacterium]|nr:hypothetical protein [Actinomycetota bacterium]